MKKLLRIFLVSIFVISASLIYETFVYAEESVDITPAEEFRFRYVWFNGDSSNKMIILDEYIGDKNIEEIVIPETYMDQGVERKVVEVGYECFKELSSLKRIVLPSTIRTIGTKAFKNCTSLEKVEGLPEYEGFFIGKEAFSGCTSLNEFKIYDNIEYNIWAYAFENTPWYENFVKNDTDNIIMIGTTVYDMNNCSGDVKIPENATKIENCSFCQDEEGEIPTVNHNITSVYIPSGLDDIENFYPIGYSKNLKSVTVEKGNKVFFSENGILFENNEDFGVNLVCYPAKKEGTSYTIKKEVGLVSGIHSEYLKKVTFEEGAKPILSSGAFDGCKNLKEITILNGTTIVEQAFRNTGLKSISLPAEFDEMCSSGGSMFTGCTTLENISLNKNNQKYKLVNGALISLKMYDGEKNYTLIGYPASKGGETLVIPDGVTIAYSLEEAKNLKTIIVPKSLGWINLAESKELGNIKNIKYLGSKSEFEEKVYISGVYENLDSSDFNMYYNCKSLNNANISNLNSKYAYTGKAIIPPITVKYGSTSLTKNKNYIIAGKNNKSVGKATITVTGKGNYYGTKTATFMIVPKKVSTLTSYLYQYGNKAYLKWSAAKDATGYKVEYKKPGSSKYTHLTYTKNSFYSKGDLKAGKTYYFKITPYYEYNGKKYYGTLNSCYKTVTVKTTTKGKKMTTVNQPVISESGTKVKVKWKNVSGETGYQISKSSSKTGTNIVSTYKTKTGTYKLLSATKGKTYYYKVRAYRTVNGKNIYGAWSTVKSYKR